MPALEQAPPTEVTESTPTLDDVETTDTLVHEESPSLELSIKQRLEMSYEETRQRFADFKGGSLEAWNAAYSSGNWAVRSAVYAGKMSANFGQRLVGNYGRYEIHPIATPVKKVGGVALKTAGVTLYYGPKELALSTDTGKDYLKRKEERQAAKLEVDIEKRRSAEKVARRLNRLNRASRRAGKQYAVDKDGNVVVSKTA